MGLNALIKGDGDYNYVSIVMRVYLMEASLFSLSELSVFSLLSELSVLMFY